MRRGGERARQTQRSLGVHQDPSAGIRVAVDTAAEKGWAELTNGELLDQAESEEYELLITADQSMRYQQNLRRRQIAFIVLRSNRWPDVLLRVDDIRAALNRMQPGELREVEI